MKTKPTVLKTWTLSDMFVKCCFKQKMLLKQNDIGKMLLLKKS